MGPRPVLGVPSEPTLNRCPHQHPQAPAAHPRLNLNTHHKLHNILTLLMSNNNNSHTRCNPKITPYIRTACPRIKTTANRRQRACLPLGPFPPVRESGATASQQATCMAKWTACTPTRRWRRNKSVSNPIRSHDCTPVHVAMLTMFADIKMYQLPPRPNPSDPSVSQDPTAYSRHDGVEADADAEGERDYEVG